MRKTKSTTKTESTENSGPRLTLVVPLRDFVLTLAKDKQMWLNHEIEHLGDYARPVLNELKARYAGQKFPL